MKGSEAIAKQVVRVALRGEIVSCNGKVLPHKVETLCVHGDEPTANWSATAARKALKDAGVKIVLLTKMKLNQI